jgi:hypothetical protein
MADDTNEEGGISDPVLYAKMSEPFATEEEAGAAFKAFSRDFRKLRAKHRIANAIAVCAVNVQVGDAATSLATVMQNGASSETKYLLAWALGATERREATKLEAIRRSGVQNVR